MTYQWQTATHIAERRIVAIIRAQSSAEAVEVGRTLLENGIDVVEVSLVTPGALSAIEELAGIPGAVIGAGTVLDEASARASILAGGTFLVAPNVAPDVIRCGNRYGVPTLAGAQTPTEAVAALEAGAAMVKLFPAAQLGPGFLTAVRAALPQAPFVPTGGVSAANAAEWLAAGATALGIGGSLTGGTLNDVASTARALREIIS